MMRQDIYDYAVKMAEWAESFMAIGAKVPVVQADEIRTVNQVERDREIVKGCIEEYASCKQTLSNISCPPEISNEHEQIQQAIDVLISGLRLMEGSGTIINCGSDGNEVANIDVNRQDYIKGIAAVDNATKTVSLSVDVINNKFEQLLTN